MQTLLLVRHGNTRWNTKHLIQGKTDIPLSIEGIKESKKIEAELYEKKNVTTVIND